MVNVMFNFEKIKSKKLWLLSVFFILIFIYGVYRFDDLDNKVDLLPYLQGLTTELLGILITVFIIDKIYKKYEDNVAKKEERRQILRIDGIINLFFKNSYISAKELFIADINEINEFNLKKPPFKNLKHCWLPSSLMNKDFNKTKYQHYYESLDELTNYIKIIITQYNFDFYKEYNELLYDYLQKYLNEPKSLYNLDCVKKIIKDSDQFLNFDECPSLIPSNSINYFVWLYKSTQNLHDFIESYGKIIDKIKNDKI